MTPNRLYTVVDAYTDDDYYTMHTYRGSFLEFRKPVVCPHPEEWAEFSLRRHGEVVDFYLPASARIYRSRSAAVARRDLIRYWGGKAEVLECTPVWESVDAANARRDAARINSRIVKKRAELAALEAQHDAALGYEAVA